MHQPSDGIMSTHTFVTQPSLLFCSAALPLAGTKLHWYKLAFTPQHSLLSPSTSKKKGLGKVAREELASEVPRSHPWGNWTQKG
mmetsp:Transcript_39297/g.104274  ORF Transcript_39297/g.104274 Transcript_39297/m.104274 type:complete len:84 (-) Transcript_39297:30-281(-)